MPVVNSTILQDGPIFDLLVGVSQARQQMLEKHGFPVPPRVPVRALIDTGSSLTAVIRVVFQQLSLPGPVGSIDIVTPSTRDSSHCADLYDVSLALSHLGEGILFPSIRVIEFPGSDEVQALIGRDVLAHCHFTYDGPGGRFTLGF